MIGNDVVDLAKAKKESNIFRPRYLEKVCNQQELEYILSSSHPESIFWRLWTMKESAYKALQRALDFETRFNPFAFACSIKTAEAGLVKFEAHQVETLTLENETFVYSEVFNALEHQRFFGSLDAFLDLLKVKHKLDLIPKFEKTESGMPFICIGDVSIKVSKTHHGEYQVFQY